MTKFAGYFMIITGWLLIWSQIPEGVFSGSGAIVIGGILIGTFGEALTNDQ